MGILKNSSMDKIRTPLDTSEGVLGSQSCLRAHNKSGASGQLKKMAGNSELTEARAGAARGTSQPKPQISRRERVESSSGGVLIQS